MWNLRQILLKLASQMSNSSNCGNGVRWLTVSNHMTNALDAGCGHRAETLWLAAHGWQVAAVHFSASALAHGRSTAEALGHGIAERIDWVEGDLGTWAVPPERYDLVVCLVVCLYVHIADSVDEMVRRMAPGVAPGGTLLMVGHRPVDPAMGTATAFLLGAESMA